MIRGGLHLALLALCTGLHSAADITGSLTLSSNQTFTSTGPNDFSIGSAGKTLNLQNYTATFTGSSGFQVNSSIKGSGGVLVDLSNPTQTVEYNAGNSYSGLTTVRSGRLLLDTPMDADNGVPGDLYIGGGPNSAAVTRPDNHNRELIGDTSTITVAKNGTLVFNRSNSSVNDSVERFGKLVLDGGTLINSSAVCLPTLAHIGTVTLLSDSVIDLGKWMTVVVDNVENSAWNPNATLTIRNWSILEPVYFHEITPQQVSQIRFETPDGLMGAREVFDGLLIPTVIVPEAPTWIFIPLLAGAVAWVEIGRCRRQSVRQGNTGR